MRTRSACWTPTFLSTLSEYSRLVAFLTMKSTCSSQDKSDLMSPGATCCCNMFLQHVPSCGPTFTPGDQLHRNVAKLVSRDPPTWNRLRKELWEFAIPICDWFILIWLQELVPRTVHTKRFEEHVAGTCPKNSNQFELVGLVAGTKLILVPATKSCWFFFFFKIENNCQWGTGIRSLTSFSLV